MGTKTKSSILLGAIGILVLLVVIYNILQSDISSSKTKSQEPAIKTIKVGTFTKSLGNSPFHVAYHFKWFNEEKALESVSIEYTNYNDRPSISDAFASGQLDILFSAAIPQILCRAQGNDIRTVAMSASMNQDILVRKELPISTLSDLRGKSLAVLQGTSSYFGLLKILQEENMTLEDFDIRYLAVAEARTAFESGQIDSWAVWAPYVEQQQASGKGKLIAAGRAPINSTIAVSAEFLKKHPKIVFSFVQVILRAKNWIPANPKETQDIIANDFGLDKEVIAIALGKFNWGAEFNENIIGDLQWKANFMAKAGQTRTNAPIRIQDELLDFSWKE